MMMGAQLLESGGSLPPQNGSGLPSGGPFAKPYHGWHSGISSRGGGLPGGISSRISQPAVRIP